MKTNSLLTYLLYALLVALIAILGYKACQMKKDKADKAREEAELQKTLRDMGYATDSTATGSSYSSVGDSSAYYTSPKPDANGIVDAPTTTKPTTTKPTTTNPTTTTKATTTQPTTTAPQLTEKGGSTPTALTTKGNVGKVKGPGTGKYSVRAGTFASKENARTRLEEVIKLRYATAEVKQLPTGKWAVVILRTNDRTQAVRLADQLTAKGIDAAVF